MAVRPHRRSFIRKLRRLSVNRQIAMHEEYGSDEIYIEGQDKVTVADFVESLRPKNEALVAAVAVLARRRDGLREVIDEIERRKVVIVELETKRRSDDRLHLKDMVLDAVAELARDSRPPRKQLSAWGKKGAAKRAPERPTTVDEARAIWFDRRVKTYADAEAKSGWKWRTLHNRFGKRGKD